MVGSGTTECNTTPLRMASRGGLEDLEVRIWGPVTGLLLFALCRAASGARGGRGGGCSGTPILAVFPRGGGISVVGYGAAMFDKRQE